MTTDATVPVSSLRWASTPVRSPRVRVARPPSSSAVPARTDSSVLLPAPLRPTMPIRSPAATPADTPSSSGRCPYALTARSRLTRFTAGVFMCARIPRSAR